ncbi:MAG TPA: hypothetical protein VK853_00535 [Ilumatobacteraceae bacterium]|nr:hypothetical protein [Ilumatobacteraceae bacterium]
MKPFAIWLAIVAVIFGGYALVSSSLQETSRVFVVVDTSLGMETKDDEVRRELDRIDDRGDAEFALANASSRPSNSGLVHTWQSDLRWDGAPRFGPCSFADIESFTEATDADDRILITTSDSCDTSTLVDWEIILLD